MYIKTSDRPALTDSRYHTQSPEAFFTHTPGLRVVIPRSPIQAKGLLLSAIRSNDPVIFMEPKILYRAAVEQVPVDAYHLPLDKAEVLKTGKDITIVSYGTPLYTCSAAITAAEKDFGCSIELIDLRTIYPWDRETVLNSVKKTGRAIVVHESMMNAGVGAEVAATIQEKAFLRLEAPVKRVAGWATHTGLMFEQFIIPDVTSKFQIPLSCRYDIDNTRGLRCDQKDIRLLMRNSSRFKSKPISLKLYFSFFHLRSLLVFSPLPFLLLSFWSTIPRYSLSPLTWSHISQLYTHCPWLPDYTDTPALPYAQPPPTSSSQSLAP
jgi:hypothetical protein